MSNEEIVTTMLLRAIAMTQQYASMLNNARREGRTISDEEIADLKAGYAYEREGALADIEARRDER